VYVLADVAGPEIVKKALLVPPLATGRIPVTPVVSGNPVQLVSVPLVGVPSSGVTSVGLLSMTNFDPVPVCEATEVALPTEVIGPVRLALVVTVAALPVMFV